MFGVLGGIPNEDKQEEIDLSEEDERALESAWESLELEVKHPEEETAKIPRVKPSPFHSPK